MGEKNIFETAAKQLGKKKPPKKVAESTPPSSIPVENPQKSPPNFEKFKNNQDPETAEMMQKIKEMKQDLQNKIDFIQKKGGMLGQNFQNYINNPKNFNDIQWQEIQKAKQMLGDKIWKAIGAPIEQETDAPPSAPPVPHSGSRKAKTLGVRKKWIPIK